MESKEKIIIVALIVIIVAVLVGIVATMSVGEKQDTNLTFKSNSTLTEGDSLKFKLTDSNGTAIANKTVNVTITDKNDAKYYYSVKTNKNGTGTIKLDKDPGKYNVTVKFGGTKEYNACHATKQITVKEEVVESQPAQQSSSSSSSDNGNYYNGYSRSEFSEGEQAAIDDARAHGYSSPAAYYQATGKTAGQAYLDAHPELADRR